MVESDFLKIYNSEDPLGLEWRKFYRLLGTMPLDQSLFFAPQYSALQEGGDPNKPEEPPEGWWKEEFDRRRGRANKQRVPTTIDTMLQEQKDRIGKDNAG